MSVAEEQETRDRTKDAPRRPTWSGTWSNEPAGKRDRQRGALGAPGGSLRGSPREAGGMGVNVTTTKPKSSGFPVEHRLGDVRPTGAQDFAAMAVDALAIRCGFQVADASFESRQWANRSRLMLSIANQMMTSAGASGLEMLTDEDCACAALGLETHSGFRAPMAAASAGSPSDFPTLLSALIRKGMEQPYGEDEFQYRRFAKRIADQPDFRPATLLRTGEFGEFPELDDKEEFKEASTAEEVGWISVGRYGQSFSISPVMMANDDTGALSDIGAQMASAHDATLNRLCVELLTSNAPAPDGLPLFHANHANIVATAAGAPSVEQIGKMQELMRRQRGVSNLRPIGMKVGLLVVPPSLELPTLQTLADITVVPATDDNANPYRGQIEVAVESMLEDKPDVGDVEWYAFTRNPLAQPIIYAHQVGYSGMQQRSYTEFKTQCRTWQFEGRFGAAIRGTRGVVRNAGE